MNAGTTSNNANDQFPFALSQSLLQVAKVIWLALLLGLFFLSIIVWIWIASFRNGWRFGDWVKSRARAHESSEQVTIGLLYGLIIVITLPFFIFVDWAQKTFDKVLPEWMKLPAEVPIQKAFKQRLGIDLGDEFPFFVEEKGAALSGQQNNFQ